MYYITITPMLYTVGGNRIEMAPVQYEISEEHMEVGSVNYPRTEHNYLPESFVSFPFVNSVLNGSRLGFKVDISNEQTPKGKAVEPIGVMNVEQVSD